MKRILALLTVLCLICACSAKQKSSDKSSWFGEYKKGDITLAIEDTDDFENAFEFSIDNGNDSYGEVAFYEDDDHAKIDLGEEGIVISFTKNNDIISCSVEGDFTYFDGDITGDFRRV